MKFYGILYGWTLIILGVITSWFGPFPDDIFQSFVLGGIGATLALVALKH